MLVVWCAYTVFHIFLSGARASSGKVQGYNNVYEHYEEILKGLWSAGQ